MSDDRLYNRIARILEHARGQVARTVNTAMVQRMLRLSATTPAAESDPEDKT